MKKLIFFSLTIISFFSFAQTNEFKKLMDNGNAKYGIKSYGAAVYDYDNAVKLVAPEIDKLIAAKSSLTPEKAYMLEPYVKRASCNYFLGKVDLMKADLAKVTALDSANLIAKVLKGYEFFKSGDKAGGCGILSYYKDKKDALATKIFDDCFCYSEGVNFAKEGLVANNLKKYEEGLKKFSVAASILPDSSNFHAEKGRALYGLGKTEEAIQCFNTAILKNPKSYRAYYYKAIANNKLGNNDSAFANINKCLEFNPKHYDAHLLSADIAEKLEQWNAAVFNLKYCIKVQTENGKLYYRIAKIMHEKQNDLFDACEYYKGAASKGVEEAKEMAANCDNPKYMKKYRKNAEKEKK